MFLVPCRVCEQHPTQETVPLHHYIHSGLPNVYLRDAEVRVCDCGTRLMIKSAPALQKLIACCLAYKPQRITGVEIKYIRSAINTRAVDFARLLSITPQHLSAVENSKQPLSAPVEKLIRLWLVVHSFEGQSVAVRELFSAEAVSGVLDQKVMPEDDGTLGLFVRCSWRSLVSDFEFEFRKV